MQKKMDVALNVKKKYLTALEKKMQIIVNNFCTSILNDISF